MSDYIGLYYPHIRLRNDAWIKLAALYWDKLGRIVPDDYHPQDNSNTIQRLKEELDFIKDLSPTQVEKVQVASIFVEMLEKYQEQLKVLFETSSYTHSDWSDIYGSKFEENLGLRLLKLGLAKAPIGTDYLRWPMAAPLADVYMEALAEEMASNRQFHPVTNKERSHIAMGPYTIERLTQALHVLDNAGHRLLTAADGTLLFREQAFHVPDNTGRRLIGSSPTSNEVEGWMATIAFQSVLPHDITNVPVEKIIQLRQKHRAELTVFQTGIRDFVTKLDIAQQIGDPKALKAHLEVAYEKELKPELDDLKKCMKSVGIETITGMLNVKLTAPPLLAGGAAQHLFTLPPIVAGATTIACCVFPILQKKRAEMHNRVHTSPVSYLFYIQEGLTPTNVVSHVTQNIRERLFGV